MMKHLAKKYTPRYRKYTHKVTKIHSYPPNQYKRNAMRGPKIHTQVPKIHSQGAKKTFMSTKNIINVM